MNREASNKHIGEDLMCDFCKNFDFSRVKLVADKNGARIVVDQTGKSKLFTERGSKILPKVWDSYYKWYGAY